MSDQGVTKWKMVPEKATIEMSIAFAEQFYAKKRGYDDDDISDWYAAMLQAAPTPPPTDEYQRGFQAGAASMAEQAAKVAEDQAQELNRQRDPGMANHDRALAAKIRKLVP